MNSERGDGLSYISDADVNMEFWQNTKVVYDEYTHQGMIYLTPDNHGGYAIPDNAFTGCETLEWIDIPDPVTSIGTKAFDHCTALDHVELPSSLMTLGTSAFSFCVFDRIILPERLLNIPDGAFEACAKLTNVYVGSNPTAENPDSFVEGLPEGVTAIGARAFGTSGLKNIVLHERIESIGKQAFFETKLVDFTIPASVSFIDASAFANCLDLGIIQILREEPAVIGQYVFGEPSGYSVNLKLHVPSASLTAYRAADNWSYYYDNLIGM